MHETAWLDYHWVVPSTESISSPPWINMRTGSRCVLIITVENSGHMIRMLCSAAFLFSELNALLASTRITPSVLSCSNINFIEWIAASVPPYRPVATWSGPAACWMSLRNTQLIHFPTTRLVTSLMPIGRTPGFLSNGMSLHATNASRALGSKYSVANSRAKVAS